MIHRTASTIGRALGVFGFGVIVTACAAAAPTEEEGSSTEAVGARCPDRTTPILCPIAGGFDYSPFERALVALGCQGKRVTAGSGPGHDAIYETLCSTTRTASFACGSRTVTGNITTLLGCYGNSDNPDAAAYNAHLDAGMYDVSACGCAPKARAGWTYVEWDPTCSSGKCITSSY